ncbi:MAG: FAD-binding oxidoreductase [Paenibacillus macerans]|uniref:3-hydroxyacyl-CoA dehydrogenase, NAD binding domain protein n=1 Tax=Paenibacillus macerans TaxID=44252 RepID=A0A090ZVT3_PAEMA|nr:FAD-binding oxidoreductase [Paenibacillus macerans]KFN08236.1 3-hydroxyacyl-CoA dehydrogenase, NAD binding domain protein [Paenibacillus macerans]MBS5913903.1 FAD-binding oxidoreductase [Paenibacillus macerans]MCY7557566.1 FAD-binding oxidoreductase [Paenibacillus macerans]MDU7474071.1 FAD-binding oxidoreductase [Paenibacillus macerans]MEC0136185.1 FAD-binding oxidoreductase [Paenibacillus macerans]
MKKFIVIGAGILGASTAYQLAKRGAEVIIVDRKDPGQATAAAAGIICPWISQRRNQAWYRLAKEGARFYPSLIAELEQGGETETGYARVGALRLHKEIEKLVQLEKLAVKRRQDAPEIGEITLLNPGEVKRLFPPLADDYAALHISGAARVDGRALRDALLRAAIGFGATLLNGDAAIRFAGSTATGVQVEDQTIESDAVLVCAGAWANPLLKPLGVDFKATYQKAQIVHLALPDADTGHWPVVMPPGDQYILAFGGQRIVIGATHENDPQGFDTRVTAGGLQEVLNKGLQHAPGLAEGGFVEARVGFRPFTPGFLPVIGALPGWTGIYVANGLGASGLTMGPYIGFQLAKLVLGLDIDIDLANYMVEDALGR